MVPIVSSSAYIPYAKRRSIMYFIQQKVTTYFKIEENTNFLRVIRSTE